MDSTFVNIFDSVYDHDTTKRMSVLDVIWGISEKGTWKDAIVKYREEKDPKVKAELKKNLPGITFSGTLTNGNRCDANIDAYSGIVVIDIDKLSKEKLKLFKHSLRKDDYVLAFFESPSKGLKVLFKVNSAREHHKPFAFVQITEYLRKHYDIVVDVSGQNLSRLCFVSWDPDMHFHEFCDEFPVNTTVKVEYSDEEKENYKKYYQEISYDLSYIFTTARKLVDSSSIGSYRQGNRNNYVFSLACVLNRTGVSQDSATQAVFNQYGSLGGKEILHAIKSAYKHNSHEFGTKPIYQNKTSQKSFF